MSIPNHEFFPVFAESSLAISPRLVGASGTHAGGLIWSFQVFFFLFGNPLSLERAAMVDPGMRCAALSRGCCFERVPYSCENANRVPQGS